MGSRDVLTSVVAPALRKRRRQWWPFDVDEVEELLEQLRTELGRSLFDTSLWSPTVPLIPLDEPPSADEGVQSLELLQTRMRAKDFLERTPLRFLQATGPQLRRLGAALDEAVTEAAREGIDEGTAQRQFLIVVAGRLLERLEVQGTLDRISYAMDPGLSIVGSPLYLSIDTDGTVTIHGLKEDDRVAVQSHADGAVSLAVSRGTPDGTRVMECFDFTAEEARRLRLPSPTADDPTREATESAPADESSSEGAPPDGGVDALDADDDTHGTG